jgi:hypothetical protein
LPPLRPMTAAALLISDVLMRLLYTAWLASDKRFCIMAACRCFSPPCISSSPPTNGRS